MCMQCVHVYTIHIYIYTYICIITTCEYTFSVPMNVYTICMSIYIYTYMCVYMQHMYIHACSALMFNTYKNIYWG